MSDISVTLVDDSSPLIAYSGQWEFLDQVKSQFETFNNTVTASSTVGSAAVFNFTGSVVAVQVLALFDSAQLLPEAKFVLDDSTPSVWQAQPTDNGTVVAAFQSTTLSDDHHSLQIIVASKNAPILLDAIGVASKSSVTGQGEAGVSQTSIPVSTSTASPTAAGAASSGSKVPVGAIVGGVIGGVALLFLALLAAYFLCWRRRNQKPYFYSNASPEELLAGEAKQISPFPQSLNSGSQQPSSVTLSAPSAYSDSNAPLITPPTSYGGQNIAYPPSNFGGSSEHSSATGVSRSTAVLSVANTSVNTAGLTLGQRKALEAGLRTMPESSGFQHADSGVRFGETGEASGSAPVVQDAPPVYTAQ